MAVTPLGVTALLLSFAGSFATGQAVRTDDRVLDEPGRTSKSEKLEPTAENAIADGVASELVPMQRASLKAER